MAIYTKFSAEDKKRFTQDWLALFPELGSPQPMWLSERLGNLVFSIVLDSAYDDVYSACFYITDLAINSKFPTLTYSSFYRGYGISLRYHNEKYQKEAARMREQLPFPLGKDVPFQVVWKYFMNVYPQFKEGETLKILFHICRLYSHEELFPVLHKLGLKWEEDGQKAFIPIERGYWKRYVENMPDRETMLKECDERAKRFHFDQIPRYEIIA